MPPRGGPRGHKQFSDRQGTFDPTDSRRVRHTKIGVWDLYEEMEPKLARIPGSSKLEKYMDFFECMPYLLRMVKEIISIPSCGMLLILYAVCELGRAVLPAVGLWYQSQLLQIMQVAIDTRTVDKDALFHICAARIACSLGSRLTEVIKVRIQLPLTFRIRRWYGVHHFHARARLDLPTSESTHVQRQLDDASDESGMGRTVAWEMLEKAASIVRTFMQLAAQSFVVVQALRTQRDGLLLAALTFASQALHWLPVAKSFEPARVWAATTTNEDYVKMEGWKRVMRDVAHRKEVVAGNLAEYASQQYTAASDRVGDDAGDFREMERNRKILSYFSSWSLLQDPLNQLPQIVFTLRAVQYPMSMPVSLASLHLIQETTQSFVANIYELLKSTTSVTEQLATIRKLYEIRNIQNKIPDGTVPFPEDTAQIQSGISLEFINVSFRYPGAENYALRNISFKLTPGQLCVIVGANGSGKSTILKLIARLYDPEEGQILFGGHDIRTLRLHDLRQAISVLFQDYTHFPLSIRENIAIGDPSAAADEEHVRLAARLGGAEAFIEKMPEGLDTYLDRPVRDHFAGLPEGTTTLFGRKVDYSGVRRAGGMRASGVSSLSGGQMQRLAVARSFMRSVVSEDSKVGLLLFDEPSASLDPVAEADLFDRLRELRGNKTMLFSSHRFGNLTRHADLILYMNDSVIVEAGTHEKLLQQEGEYAKIWNLQAKAFI